MVTFGSQCARCLAPGHRGALQGRVVGLNSAWLPSHFEVEETWHCERDRKSDD